MTVNDPVDPSTPVVPTIPLTSFESAEGSAKVVAALREFGFLYISDVETVVPQALVDKMFACSEKTFAESEEGWQGREADMFTLFCSELEHLTPLRCRSSYLLWTFHPCSLGQIRLSHARETQIQRGS